MNKSRLSIEDAQSRLAKLNGWTITDNELAKDYQFPDFPRAFGFMATVATIAQAMDHHPDWSNSYNKVSVRLSSHDVGGLSERDFALAGKMDEVAGK